MAYGRLLVTMGISSAVALAVACGGSTSDGTSPPATDAGGTTDATSTTDGGGTDTGTTTDGSSHDTGTSGDGSATGTIKCGTGVTCDAATQVCCAGVGGGGDAAAGGGASCVAIGACTMGAAISCEGTSNCSGGDVCCLDIGTAGASTSCSASCGMGSEQICSGDSDCTPPDTCRTSQMLGGLGICRAAFDGGMHDGGGFPHPDGGTMPGDAAAD